MSETLTTSRFETPTRARVMEALEAAKEKRDAFRREARAVLRATNGAVGEENQMRRNLRRAMDAESREWKAAMQKPSALKQMLETREPCFFTPAARAAPAAAPAAAAAAVTHPFKVMLGDGEWGVYYDSRLFKSLKPSDTQSITGLLSEDRTTGWLTLAEDDAIWIKVEFDDAGAVVSASIESLGASDSFSLTAAAWTVNAYVEKDSVDDYQQYARLLIAHRPGTGAIVQVLRTDLVLRNLCVDGVPAIYPFPHTGGYVA